MSHLRLLLTPRTFQIHTAPRTASFPHRRVLCAPSVPSPPMFGPSSSPTEHVSTGATVVTTSRRASSGHAPLQEQMDPFSVLFRSTCLVSSIFDPLHRC